MNNTYVLLIRSGMSRVDNKKERAVKDTSILILSYLLMPFFVAEIRCLLLRKFIFLLFATIWECSKRRIKRTGRLKSQRPVATPTLARPARRKFEAA